MRIRNIFKRRAVVIVTAATAALVLIGTGVATAAATIRGGTTITRVNVRTEDTATVYTGAAWTTLGTSSVFAVAGGTITTRFSAESACYGGSGWCSVRILIGGVEAEPVVGTDFAFDSTDANRESSSSWESHAMERVRGALPATTTYVVAVQVTQVGAGVTARYDDWVLASEAIAP